MGSPITRALISCTDKTGIAEFAGELSRLGIEILSTGGTAAALRTAQVPVTEVGEYTGFAEILDGRVKTLHPKIHGGILMQRENPYHLAQCEQGGIGPIDLVVVNLYAFEQATATPECTVATAIENIDIGGPTMLRAAAKNCKDVTVIVDPADYQVVLAELREKGTTTFATRFYLAKKVFALTAHYDAAIYNWLKTVQI